MSYSDIEDIKNLVSERTLIALTDDSNSGVIDEAKILEAISSADAEIDGYCAVRYRVPFSDVPSLIKKLSSDIAVYNLYSRRGDDIPASRRERYQNAVRILEAISLGAVLLSSETSPTGAEFRGAQNIFKRETLR